MSAHGINQLGKRYRFIPNIQFLRGGILATGKMPIGPTGKMPVLLVPLLRYSNGTRDTTSRD